MRAVSSLPRLDANTPTSARVHDYLLGGSHNFAVDRDTAQEMITIFPALSQVVSARRAFLRRAVRFLAAERGICQFLDLGCGIPTARNVHEIAQAVSPTARVAYVDIDPIAVAHSRSVLRGVGYATCVQGDLRDPAAIRSDPAIRAVIDFSRPVAVVLSAVLHYVPGDQAAQIVDRYLSAAAPGSYLLISHHAAESTRTDEARAMQLYGSAVHPVTPRTCDQVTAFFSGTEIVDPGVVLTSQWRPDPAEGTPPPPPPQAPPPPPPPPPRAPARPSPTSATPP
jgi:O-methyltransferase involved in polyketide biosynthesis